MADTGWVYPSSAVSWGTAQVRLQWASPEYIEADDANNASVAPDQKATTDYLIGYNFALASLIPDGATINGIEFAIMRCASTSEIAQDLSLYIGKYNGTTFTTSGSNMASASYWGVTLVEIVYGGSSNTWGSSYTRSDIIGSDFGVGLQKTNLASGYVDYFKIKVYYTGETVAAGGGSLVGSGALVGGKILCGNSPLIN